MPVALNAKRPVRADQAANTNAVAPIAANTQRESVTPAKRTDQFGGIGQAKNAAPPAAVDPPFMPVGFDVNAAVDGLRKLLVDQGVPLAQLQPGKALHTLTTDFDGTLGRSGNIPVFLRAKADVVDANGAVTMKAGDYFKDDKGNDLMLHGLTGVDVGNDMTMLKTKYPTLPWASVTQDWSAWDDRALTMKTPLEDKMVRRIKDAAKATEPTASFIITARTNAQVAGGMHEALKARGTDVTGVICTGDAAVQKQLHVDDPKLSDGQRKALVQMIIVTMYGGVKSHSFTDDGPGNDAASISSLAAKFPTTNVSVFQAVHVVGKNHSTPKLIAQSNGLGGFNDPRDGSAWTPEKIDAFAKSTLPPLPQLTPDSVARGRDV